MLEYITLWHGIKDKCTYGICLSMYKPSRLVFTKTKGRNLTIIHKQALKLNEYEKIVKLNDYLDGLSYFLHQNEILFNDNELTVEEYINSVKSLMDKIGEEL